MNTTTKSQMNVMTVEELKTAYAVITQIMKTNNLMKDNSFNRVRNWISNALCDCLIK